MIEFDMASVKVLARDLRFPEGPVALSDGSVMVVEIEGDAVAHIAPDGTVKRYACATGPNGMAIGPDGAAYVCTDGGLLFEESDGIRYPVNMLDEWVGGDIQRLDIATGKVSKVFDHVGDDHIGSLNDIVFDTAGGCYIVDTSQGSLYYSDPVAGTINVAETGVDMPNGMGLSPDGKTLYVSETFAGNIFRWDVTGPGKLANRTLHYSSGGEHGFDGLAIDGQGNVCASNLAQSGITVISPTGEKLGAFTVPLYDSFVTNICFGGPDLRTAYVCSSGRGILYSVQWPWPGLALTCNA